MKSPSEASSSLEVPTTMDYPLFGGVLSGNCGCYCFLRVFGCCPRPPVEGNAMQYLVEFYQPIFHAFVDVFLEKGFGPDAFDNSRAFPFWL